MLVFAVIAALSAAADPFAACDARVSSAPRALDSYLCYHAVARGEGRAVEAARRLRARLSRDPGNAAARLALALVEQDRARDEAGPLFRGAAEGFAARGDADGEVRALLGLVAFRRARGDRAEPDAALDRAQRVAARAGDAVLPARVGIRHAGRYYRDGDFGRAQRTLKEIEGALFPDGPADQRAYWLLTMGNVLWAIGSPEETAGCWERAVTLLHAAGDRYEEANVRSNLLFVAPDLGWSRDQRLAMAEDVGREPAQCPLLPGRLRESDPAHR